MKWILQFKIALLSRHFLIGLAFTSLNIVSVSAATITSTASGGSWANGGTWVGGLAPTAGDNVIIATTTGSVTIGSNVSCVNLTINSRGVLTLNGTRTLNVTGDLNMPRPANGYTSELNVNGGTLNVSGTFTMSASSGTRYALLNITTGTANLSDFSSAGNASQIIFAGSGTVNFEGTIAGTKITIVPDIGTLNFGGSEDQLIWKTTYNNLIISGTGVKTLSTGVTIVSNVLTVESGANLNLNAQTISLSGTGDVFQADGTIQTSGSTLRFIGVSDQNVPGITYGNLTFSDVGTKILADATSLTINGNWVCNSPVTMNGSAGVDVSGNITGNGAITMNTGLITIGGSWTNSAALTAGTGKIIYSSADPQTVRQLTYYDLELSGAGLKTGSNITVDHVCTINTGTEFDMLTRTLTLNGAGTPLVNNGTISGSTYKITYAGELDQNIAEMSYMNLICEGAGTKIIDDGNQVNVGINWTNNSPVTLAGSAGMSIIGNITGAGNISMGTGTLSIEGNWTNSGTLTPGSGTVSYSANGNQSMQTINYYNLTLSGTGVKSFSAGSPLISNVLTVDNGVELNYGNRTIELSGPGLPLVVNGSLSGTTGTISFTGIAAQQIPGISYRNLSFTGGDKTINSADTITVEINWQVDSEAILSGNASAIVSGDIIGDGNITMNNGTLTLAGTYSNTGSFTANTGTFLYNSDSGTQLVSADINYYDLGFAGTAIKTIADDTVFVANSWDVESPASLTGTGSVDITEGISGVGAITMEDGIISIEGLWDHQGVFDPGNGTVHYDGSDQGVAALNYYDLQVSEEGTKTLEGNIVVSNVMSINAPALFDLGSNIITLSGSSTPLVSTGIVIPATSTVNYTSTSDCEIAAVNYHNLDASGGNRVLPAGGTVGISGTFIPGVGTYTVTGSTVEFNGDLDQTIPPFTFYDLLISGDGTKLIDSVVNVNEITIEDGSMVNLFSDGNGVLNITNE